MRKTLVKMVLVYATIIVGAAALALPAFGIWQGVVGTEAIRPYVADPAMLGTTLFGVLLGGGMLTAFGWLAYNDADWD